MKQVIEKIKKIVLENDKDNLVSNHISIVVDYALELCKIEKVDKEVIEIAAWLHDIGRLKFGGKNHNKTGSKEARKILVGLNYDSYKIDIVCQMILNHNIDDFELSHEDEVLRCADALSHLDIVPFMLLNYVNKKDSLKLGIERMIKKLDDEWDSKVSLESARKISFDKYKAAKLLLESNLKILCK